MPYQLTIIVQIILNLAIEIGRLAIHELRTPAKAGRPRPVRRRTTMKRIPTRRRPRGQRAAGYRSLLRAVGIIQPPGWLWGVAWCLEVRILPHLDIVHMIDSDARLTI